MIFNSGFSNWDEVLRQFDAPSDYNTGLYPLIAIYDIDSYEGSAFVLFWKQGYLYLVTGAHCSCYGLEGQWDPEIVTITQLQKIANEGSGIMNRYKIQINELVHLLDGKDEDELQKELFLYSMKH